MKRIEAIVAIAVAVLFAGNAAAAPWKVGENGVTKGDKIRWAVSQAESGDTILVYPGTYRDLGIKVTKKLVILSAEGPEKTILDGDGLTFIFYFPSLGGESVVEGFTLENGKNKLYGGAIKLDNDSSPVLRHNIFRNNFSAVGGALYLPPRCNSLVENNLFIGNRTDTWGGAIYSQLGEPIIRNNTFINNSAKLGGAAVGLHSSSPKLTGNIFADHAEMSAVLVKTPKGEPEFGCNVFWNNGGDAYGVGENMKPVHDGSMKIVDPLFADKETFGLAAGSPCADAEGCGLIGWTP